MKDYRIKFPIVGVLLFILAFVILASMLLSWAIRDTAKKEEMYVEKRFRQQKKAEQFITTETVGSDSGHNVALVGE